MKKDNRQLIEGTDYLIDPVTGLLVFTRKYHLKRGYCCKSRCRNCPYGYKKPKPDFEK